MTKSILVIDTPNNCGECKICASWQESAFSPREYWCPVSENNDVDPDSKPDWCPLKLVPEKIDVLPFDASIKAYNRNAEEVGMYMYNRGHDRGYNICIDKILRRDK